MNDILALSMPYAKELLLARFNPSDTSGLLMKSLLKFQGLAEDVRYYGKWMRDEAEKRIGHLYPKVEVTAAMVKEVAAEIAALGVPVVSTAVMGTADVLRGAHCGRAHGSASGAKNPTSSASSLATGRARHANHPEGA